jgi:hypothetical protein
MSLYLTRHVACMYTCPPRTTACKGSCITPTDSTSSATVTARVHCSSDSSSSSVSAHTCSARHHSVASVHAAGRRETPHVSIWMDGSWHGRWLGSSIYSAVVHAAVSSSDPPEMEKSSSAHGTELRPCGSTCRMLWSYICTSMTHVRNTAYTSGMMA